MDRRKSNEAELGKEVVGMKEVNRCVYCEHMVYMRDNISLISSPKASNGQRFPCPTFSLVFMEEGMAAALIGDKVL